MTETEPKKLGEAQTKLVAALREAKAPDWMIDRSLDGGYDDYKSEFDCPITVLVQDARRAGLRQIADRAINGEFDGTTADSEAWAVEARKDPEMAKAMDALGMRK